MRPSAERVAVVLALVVAAGAAFFFRTPESRSTAGLAHPEFSGTSYMRHDRAQPSVARKTWDVPPALQKKLPWASDLFTPPNVIFDRKAKTYVLVELHDAHSGAAQPKRSAPVPFRVQLVGYVGSADRSLGIFENVITGEVVVAGEGAALIDRQFVVGKIQVGKTAAESHAPSSRSSLATAVLRDTIRGEEVVLTDGAKVYLNAASDNESSSRDDVPTLAAGQGMSVSEESPITVNQSASPQQAEPLQATTNPPELESESASDESDTKPESA
jgi:hypothetical protein